LLKKKNLVFVLKYGLKTTVFLSLFRIQCAFWSWVQQ